MKRNIGKLTFTAAAVFSILMFASFYHTEMQGAASVYNVVLQFVAYNDFGNNLYIDNVSVGSRMQDDAAPTSIENIPVDTAYSYFGSSSFKVSPSAGITNIGINNISSPFTVTMKASPGNYTSTKTVQSLNRTRTVKVSFDSLTLSPGTGFNITVYSSLPNDLNRSNDTIRQYSYFLPGVKRKVLFESFTSATCGPCAIENPPLDSFVTQRFDSIVAISYHMNWPAPGNDPMYLANPQQNTDRRTYYSISAVPILMVDGSYRIVSGYTTLSNLTTPFYNQLGLGTPVSISVTDTRIPGDSIKANVMVNILSPLPAGNYYLRVHAVERTITYQTPPGTNGETVFYDVFRRAYPNSQGTLIPVSPGVYNYEFRYKRESIWVDSMIYTAAFIQNDADKEILNCAKARHYASLSVSLQSQVLSTHFIKPVGKQMSNSIAPQIITRKGDRLLNGFIPELFEWYFPPAGWSVVNPDSGITFSQFAGASGPSFGGEKCVRMDFYNYESQGQTDYLYSQVYYDVQPGDSIKFDWAYAQFPGYYDRLQVNLSTDGGNTFPFTIFDRAGDTLATAPIHTEGFVPLTDNDWGTFGTTLQNIISVQPISQQVPYEFRLYQNYPNPFNPSTKIKFDIPLLRGMDAEGERGVLTRLTIYDLLGREVAELVNQQLKPGTYEVVWDGKNNASGVYFYRLTASNFISTRKMVLVK
jgi:hypothetical protein